MAARRVGPGVQTGRLLSTKNAVALLLAAAVVLGCGNKGPLLGLPIDEVRSRLSHRDYEFLTHRSFDERELRRVSGLGEGAYHNLARVYDTQQMPREAGYLLELSWQHERDPWRRESALLLLDRLLEREEYEEARTLGSSAAAEYADVPEVVHRYHTALYRTGRLEELSSALDGLEPGEDTELPQGIVAERALWHAVIDHESGTGDRHATTVRAFTDHPIGDVHTRLAVYVNARPEFRSGFTATQLQLFAAKQFASEGRYDEALAAFRTALPGANELQTAEIIRDVFVVGLNAQDTAAAAELLAAIASGLGNAERSSLAYEYAGRLHRTRYAYGRAAELLSAAQTLLQDPKRVDRVLWYLRDVELAIDPLAALRRLRETVAQIQEPAYFDDYFYNLASALIERRRWAELLDAYEVLRDVAGPGVLARYQFTLGLAARHRLLEAAESEIGEQLLARASEQRDNLYYAIVASAVQGKDVQLPAAWLQTAYPANADAAVDEERTALIDGYRCAGLLTPAYDLFEPAPETVSLTTGAGLLRDLTSASMIRESIRTTLLLRSHPARDADGDLLPNAYPYAYGALIDRIAQEEGLDPHLFRALVREESLFDPSATSWAGAVGLSQLMPETAADIARRMRLEYDDLTDPEPNLQIGGHYLSLLLAQFGLPIHALAAYNAGQGRVRRWEAELPRESEFLFLESIPFDETRSYLRQVLVSFVFYGYLYADRSSAGTVGILFPDR